MNHDRRHEAAALLLAFGLLAGCPANECPSEPAKVSTAPRCSALAPSTTVTVVLPICTSCNQTQPECVVVPPQGDATYQLDTTVQACTAGGDCPISCPTPLPVATCTFVTPPVGANNDYQFLIVNPDGTSMPPVQFQVAAGGATSCSG